MASESKISVYSLSDLKNTTDDALAPYLTTLPGPAPPSSKSAARFTQVHTLTDVRLALGYAAVVIAGALFYYDYKQGWEASRPYTLPAVVAYFVLNTALTLWIWGVEKGVVFEGVQGSGKGTKIRISSSTKKHDPIYRLHVDVTPVSGEPKTHDVAAPFARFFTADGRFAPKPFQQWLASSVPAVGAADPDNVIEDIGRGSGLSAEGSATGFVVGGGKGAKRRKA